jgi:hypothetical protein
LTISIQHFNCSISHIHISLMVCYCMHLLI